MYKIYKGLQHANFAFTNEHFLLCNKHGIFHKNDHTALQPKS